MSKGGKGGRAGEGVRTGSWFLIPLAVRRRQEEGKGGSQRGASHRLFPSPFPPARWSSHSPPKAGRRKPRAGRLRLVAATARLTKPRRVAVKGPGTVLRNRRPHHHHHHQHHLDSSDAGTRSPRASPRCEAFRARAMIAAAAGWGASSRPDLPLLPEQPNIWWGLMLISSAGRRAGPPMLPPGSGTRAVV